MEAVMKKKIPKVETINFVLRNNKTYQIMFQQGVLVVDDKIVWQLEKEKILPNITYRLKLEGTGPQNFRQRVKKGLRKGRDSKSVV